MNSNRMGTFVSSSEIDRFTLHQTLRGLMPEEVAATLMSHLPPAGRSDVALKSDIDDLLDEIDEVLESNAEEFVKNYVQKGGE